MRLWFQHTLSIVTYISLFFDGLVRCSAYWCFFVRLYGTRSIIHRSLHSPSCHRNYYLQLSFILLCILVPFPGVFQNVLAFLSEPVRSQTIRGVLSVLGGVLDIDVSPLLHTLSTTPPPTPPQASQPSHVSMVSYDIAPEHTRTWQWARGCSISLVIAAVPLHGWTNRYNDLRISIL